MCKGKFLDVSGHAGSNKEILKNVIFLKKQTNKGIKIQKSLEQAEAHNDGLYA